MCSAVFAGVKNSNLAALSRKGIGQEKVHGFLCNPRTWRQNLGDGGRMEWLMDICSIRFGEEKKGERGKMLLLHRKRYSFDEGQLPINQHFINRTRSAGSEKLRLIGYTWIYSADIVLLKRNINTKP